MIRDNTLSARWTKNRHEGPSFGRSGDLMYEWGDGCKKADGALVHNAFTGKRMHVNLSGTGERLRFDPSFVEDLIARGYDITTLRFSIKKLSAPPTEQADGN